MGIIQRQGILGTIASYIGVFIGMFNVLWLYPKFLHPEEIGLIRGLTDAASIIVPLLVLGVPPMCIRYFPMFKNEARQHYGLLTFMLLVPIMGFTLFTGLFYFSLDWLHGFSQKKSALFSEYLYLLPMLCFFMMYYSVLESYSRSLHKIAVPVLINESLVRLGVTIIVLLYAAGWVNRSSWLTIYVAIYGVAMLLIGLYIKSLGQWFVPFSIDKVIRNKVPEMANYAFFVLLGSVGAMMVGKIDSLMVIKLSGLSDGGVYSIALFIGTVIEIPRRVLSQISAPLVARQIANHQWQELAHLYQRVSINQTLAGLLLILCIWANIDNLFALMPNGQLYSAGKYVVLFIGLAKLIDMSTSINNEIITLSKYYRYHLLMMLFLVSLTIIGNLLLIPRLGITGAALATLITLFAFNLLKYIFIWVTMKMQPFTLQTGVAFLVAGIVFAVHFIVPFLFNVWLDLFLRSLIVGGLFTGTILLLHISPDANRIVLKLWNIILKRK